MSKYKNTCYVEGALFKTASLFLSAFRAKLRGCVHSGFASRTNLEQNLWFQFCAAEVAVVRDCSHMCAALRTNHILRRISWNGQNDEG